MNWLKRFIITILLLNTSFTIVNVMGIFPYKTNIAGFDYNKIVNKTAELKARFENVAGAFDYLTAGAYTLITGSEIILSFVWSIFFGFTDVLRAFMIPDSIAVPIGYAVSALLLLGIGYTILGGRG